MTSPIFFCFVGGYLSGTIPFGLIFTFLAGGGDVRRIGSGNIGATNVLRTGKKLWAILTLVCDVAKGAIPVLLAQYSDKNLLFGLIAGLGACLGHMFPAWLGFKGGKGVATYFGFLLPLSWGEPLLTQSATISLLIWLIVAFLTRQASSASLISSVGALIVISAAHGQTAFFIHAIIVILIWHRHRANIARILSGTENKITFT